MALFSRPALLEPRSAFLALPDLDFTLRKQYLAFEESQTVGPGDVAVADKILTDSTHFLELWLVAACTLELCARLGVDNIAASGQPEEYFVEGVRELTGLDPHTVIRESRDLIPPGAPKEPPRVTMTAVVRATRSILAGCPINELEFYASARGRESWGYRCRMAYDALQSFALRTDPREGNRLQIVGREYTTGALSLHDVSALLSLDPIDAVALLETHGYHRALDKISLTEAERQDRYAHIREDRLRRRGEPDFSADHVKRDVIASERVEGVDARKWLRPKPA